MHYAFVCRAVCGPLQLLKSYRTSKAKQEAQVPTSTPNDNSNQVNLTFVL